MYEPGTFRHVSGSDPHGRLETITYPDGAQRSFTYTADGEVETITRADGSVVSFAYEAGTGRLESVSVSADGVQPGGPVSYAWDPVGHLLTAGDSDVGLGFTWDSAGNQLSESLALPGVAPGLGTKAVTRVLDRAGRPAVLGLPDGEPYLQRLYDAGDRLAGLHLRSDAPADLADPAGGQALWQATYAGSRLVRMDRGNGLATVLTYGAEGRPTEVLTGPAGTGEAITRAVHRLGLGWTRGDLRRDKERQDLRRLLERFHYDGAAHLESDASRGIPAVAAVDEDLAAMLQDIDPLRLAEQWSVSQVDELVQRTRLLEGRLESPERLHDPDGLHQVRQVGARHYTWSDPR